MSNQNHKIGCVCRACMGKNPAPIIDPNEPPGGDPRWKMVGNHWIIKKPKDEIQVGDKLAFSTIFEGKAAWFEGFVCSLSGFDCFRAKAKCVATGTEIVELLDSNDGSIAWL